MDAWQTKETTQVAHDEEDLWQTSSGLPLDGAVATIAKGEFKVDNSYAAGAVVLELTFEVEGEYSTQLYSCGKQAEIKERGARIEGVRKINSQTGYGRWMDAAVALEGVKAVLAERGTPFEASVWEGLVFELGSIQIETTNPTTGKVATRSMIVPVGFEGEGEGKGSETEAAAKAAPAPAKATAKKAATKPAAAVAPAPAVEEWRVDLVQAAAKVVAEGGGHDAFVDAALELDGIATNRAAMKAVMDTTEGSIWAEAGGQ